jgi:arylsulfatase A-like enzyme
MKPGKGQEGQVEAMIQIDEVIGTLIDTAKESGIWDKMLVVVCSDHGGEQMSHGQGRPVDRSVPLIFAGPGIPRGVSHKREVSVADIAPTVLTLMHIDIPQSWDGVPISELTTPITDTHISQDPDTP